jgi:hypothetical protein
MTLGNLNKRSVSFLVVLGLLAAYSVYTNLLSGPDIPERASEPAPQAGTPAPAIPAAGGTVVPAAPRPRGRSEEFHPVLRSKRPEDRIDPMTVDPTLQLDRLAKVQAVDLAGGSRNLFQFGQPEAPKVEAPKGEEPKVVVSRFVGPKAPPPPEPPKPPQPAPPPPPIPLKYYAYWMARDNNKKMAVFMDGEEILMAGEGETLKRRYRVVRINPTSVVMEDLEVKKEQTLPLAEDVQGG